MQYPSLLQAPTSPPVTAKQGGTAAAVASKFRFTLGLRGRLVLLVVLPFVFLAALLVWDFAAQRDERLQAVSHDLLNRAKIIAARQQYLASKAEAILNSLMWLPPRRPGVAGKACDDTLSEQLLRAPEFLNIVRALPNGDLDCAAVSANSRVNLADRNYFQQALKTSKLVISEVVMGRVQGKPTITMAKAMRDDAGRVTGVLIAGLDLTWLNQEMGKTSLAPEARLVVLDAKGTVAVRQPDPEGWVGKVAVDLPLVRRVLGEGEDGTLQGVGLDGLEKVFGFTTFAQTSSGRMVLWLSMPRHAVEAPATQRMVRDVGVVLAALAGTLALLVWGGNRLLWRPVRALSQAAARFGAGEFSARTGLPHDQSEIGLLAKTLDGVAVAIADRERRLERSNRALRVLSAGNRALLRSTGEAELAAELCRAVVDAGGYRLAWVGYVEQEPAHGVRLVAAWGVEPGLLDGGLLTWSEDATARHPIGDAVRLDVARVSDAVALAHEGPWRDWMEHHRVASLVVLPLRLEGRVMGVLCFGSQEPGAFAADVVELLNESADDLAFGIHTQRQQAEHRRTRAALQLAESRFRAAANASLDALFILECVRGEQGDILDFRFADLNAPAERMLARERGQVVGKNLCELIPINRTDGFFEKYATVVATGDPLEEEFSINTPEIKAKWLRHQVVRVGDGVAISSRDITLWKEAAAAVHRLEDQNQLILNSTGEGLFGLDLDGRATFINPAGAAMLQWSVEQILGQDTHALIHHSRADGTPHPREACAICASYQDGLVHRSAEDVFWRRDGSSFPVEYVSTPIHDSQGKLLGAVASFNDITERKAAEKALARAIRALRTLSAGNEALVRATDEGQLLKDACQGIVVKGGYCMAWVGYADDNPERTITPKAWDGVDDGDLAQLQLTWADSARGQGPMSRAIRTGERQITHDFQSDPEFALWRELANTQGFVSNFSYPLKVAGRVIGALGIYATESETFDAHEIKLLVELGDDLAFGIDMLRTRAERDRIAYAHAHHAQILQKSLEQLIQVIADTVEARDPYTAGHQRRVGELAVAIARELGLSDERVHGIRLAAAVHDLGKIHVPSEILSKPGKLSEIEFMLIKTHPQAGYDILKDVDFPWPIADIVRQHHEKLDGSGYPQGLSDGQILLESRIMTVADIVEAMASHRPYRASLGVEVALNEIQRGRGSVYDTTVCDACLKLFREGRFDFQK